MWTGVHAVHTGLWDNTNFGWIDELSADVPTLGHMLRDQGYYTAFKGKWHLSEVTRSEDALERFGFADYQQWGEMFGAPLQGEMLDGAAAFEAVDWLEHQGTELDQPWLLVCSLVNPHDVMFLQTDPSAEAPPNGVAAGLQTTVQTLGWFQKQWDVELPDNFADDYALQPWGSVIMLALHWLLAWLAFHNPSFGLKSVFTRTRPSQLAAQVLRKHWTRAATQWVELSQGGSNG